MATFRIELDRDGIASLLGSKEVRDDLERRAERVKAAALGVGVLVSGIPGEDVLPIRVRDTSSKGRARFIVANDHPAGLAVEAKHRLLGSALDAAR